MDGTGSDGRRVAIDGVVVVSATEAEAGAVAFVSMREWVEQIPKNVIQCRLRINGKLGMATAVGDEWNNSTSKSYLLNNCKLGFYQLPIGCQ